MPAQISRPPTQGRQQDYQTYQVFAPLRTHWKRVSCEEVDCPTVRPARCEQVDCARHHQGWRTIVPAGSDLADLARRSGRHYVELPAAAGLIEFRFGPGQQCFDSQVVHRAAGGPCRERHLLPLDRPGIFVVRQGLRYDRRPPTNPRSGLTFPEGRSDLWAEHFAEHQDRITRQRNRT